MPDGNEDRPDGAHEPAEPARPVKPIKVPEQKPMLRWLRPEDLRRVLTGDD